MHRRPTLQATSLFDAPAFCGGWLKKDFFFLLTHPNNKKKRLSRSFSTCSFVLLNQCMNGVCDPAYAAAFQVVYWLVTRAALSLVYHQTPLFFVISRPIRLLGTCTARTSQPTLLIFSSSVCFSTFARLDYFLFTHYFFFFYRRTNPPKNLSQDV